MKRDLESELIREAVAQLQKNGMEGFSARAVAEACGVSCAPTFNHFEGRRGRFIDISKYLDQMLLKAMGEIESRRGTDYKKAHLDMNVAYINFL